MIEMIATFTALVAGIAAAIFAGKAIADRYRDQVWDSRFPPNEASVIRSGDVDWNELLEDQGGYE